MKKKAWIPVLCAVLVLALGILGVTGFRRRTGDGITRCLLIGCDRFVSMPGTEPASANNVETMAALLKDFLPEGTEITRQVNGPGTAAGFEQLTEETFRDAKAEDTSLIYLSTHGTARGDKMALLMSDGEQEEGLTPEQMRQALDRVPGEKVLILDACHSGAVIGAGPDGKNWFDDGSYRVLASSGAQEDSWFWSTETDAYTGTGYFTAAMDSALRASDAEQIDPDGSGEVSLEELTARLRQIHGASTVYCWPEESTGKLFRMPTDRKPGSHLQGISFGQAVRDGDAVVLPIRFRVEESVRVMYQLVPGRNGTWDFEHAVRLPDREKSGLVRGLVSPGVKERKIRLTQQNLGEDGTALMQVISYRGDNMVPTAEAGCVIVAVEK